MNRFPNIATVSGSYCFKRQSGVLNNEPNEVVVLRHGRAAVIIAAISRHSPRQIGR